MTELLAGSIPIPLPTYFTVGVRPLPKRVADKLSKDEEVKGLFHSIWQRIGKMKRYDSGMNYALLEVTA